MQVPKSVQNLIDPNNLQVSMCGSGNPYSVLTPLRKRLLFALHNALSIGKTFEEDLEILTKASLVQKKNGKYQPTFFIANKSEVKQIVKHAEDIGNQLATCLKEMWQNIENNYKQLKVSHEYQFQKMAMLLVGDKILDTGLLDILIEDGKFMPPFPKRPSPNNPKAQYFFWIIEGNIDALGKYGENTISLKKKNWSLLTFGKYVIDGVINGARRKLEQINDFEEIKKLHIPVVGQSDTQKWQKFARLYAKDLLNIYQKNEKSIRKLCKYSTFGEFFCWYHHIAYAKAIDILIEDGLLSFPREKFIASLWYED